MLKSITSEVKANPSNLKVLRGFEPDVKSGDIVKIPTTYLSSGSHTKVDVICDVCGIEKNIEYRLYYKSISNGGYYACSQKCSKNKAIESNMIRYGVDNPAKSDEIKSKIKNTFLEKYGVENISFLPEIVDRIIESNKKTYAENYDDIKSRTDATNMERYGVIDVNKEDWFKDKQSKLFEDKYGGHPMTTNVVKDKMKKTFDEKYGGHPMTTDFIKDKLKNTFMSKYGVDNPFKSEYVKDKIKKTCMERYGVEYPSQCPEIYEKNILSGYRTKEYNGIRYQGTYEKDFILFCIDRNINISKPRSIKYEMDDKIKRYFPDFYIEDYNLIIEVKSTYYNNIHFDKNINKKNGAINAGFNYLMILDKNYDEFINFIN